jgi:hypothetical protein
MIVSNNDTRHNIPPSAPTKNHFPANKHSFLLFNEELLSDTRPIFLPARRLPGVLRAGGNQPNKGSTNLPGSTYSKAASSHALPGPLKISLPRVRRTQQSKRRLLNLCCRWEIPNTPKNNITQLKKDRIEQTIIMQNKPNFKKGEKLIKTVLKMTYTQMDTWFGEKNKPNFRQNKPNSNPILPSFFLLDMALLYYTASSVTAPSPAGPYIETRLTFNAYKEK